MAKEPLPVPVEQHPHWRVVFRPDSFQPQRIPSLKKCWETIEHSQVRLRGWDFPHVSRHSHETGQGSTWIAGWSDFMERYEYWRMYQSGQFVHLSSVRETEPAWREELLRQTRGRLGHIGNIDWKNVPGCFHIGNFIYTLTEIFEFAARLAQRGLYDGSVGVSVEILRVKGFVLTTDWERAWHHYYPATEDTIGRKWDIKADSLIAQSSEVSFEAVLWFFERFGWLDPPTETLRQDQRSFLSGRR